MSNGTWLIMDVSNLCYRALHTTGDLSFNDEPTGVIFGMLRDIEHMKDRFNTSNIIFAFDRGYTARKEILPTYKEGRRKERTEEEQEARKQFLKQIRLLRLYYLPELGYRNIFSAPGFEADDIIAECVLSLDMDDVVIVSGDKDLFQLLRSNVRCFNPISKQVTTLKSFMSEWGINPGLWPNVKAIAGDPGDNIAGVKGVGLKTAVKWVNGQLKKESKAYRSIDQNLDLITTNLKLISLPIAGCPSFRLQKDKTSHIRRRRVYRKLGIRSL